MKMVALARMMATEGSMIKGALIIYEVDLFWEMTDGEGKEVFARLGMANYQPLD